MIVGKKDKAKCDTKDGTVKCNYGIFADAKAF